MTRAAYLPDALTRSLGRNARALARRGALLGAAGLSGAVGCGLVLFAAFAALRPWLGPGLAALVLGIALLALAAVLVWLARRPPAARPPPATPQPDAPVSPADPTTVAVFTLAFLLGRRLADRRRG